MILVVYPGSRIPDPDPDFLPMPDPRSRGQKGTGFRIRITNRNKHYCHFNFNSFWNLPLCVTLPALLSHLPLLYFLAGVNGHCHCVK